MRERMLGQSGEHELSAVMKAAHVAVFTSRAESGTNLFATQALGMGIPTILSANSGHLDLLALNLKTCYPLQQQMKLRTETGIAEGWGESSVEELQSQMLAAYQKYQDGSIDDGSTASRKMHTKFSWKQTYRVFAAHTQLRSGSGSPSHR